MQSTNSISKLFFGFLVASVMAGCASQAPQTPQTTQKTTIAGTKTGAADAVGISFGENLTSKIDGKNTKLFRDRSLTQLSLVDAVKATGKKVAVFQFAGVDCIECHDVSQMIDRDIASNPEGHNIAHILVLTDKFADYEDASFKNFINLYAPTAFVVYDQAIIWKKFSQDPALPNRATILAMTADQIGVLYQTSARPDGTDAEKAQADADRIVNAAAKLAQ